MQKSYSKQIITNSLVEKKIRQLLEMCYADYNLMIDENKYVEAATKRDNIRNLIKDFQLEGHEALLEQLNLLDYLALKKQD